MREKVVLRKPDPLGGFASIVGFILFVVYWQAGIMGLVLGYVLHRQRSRTQAFGVALGAFLLLAFWIGIDYWQFFTFGLVVWLSFRFSKSRFITLDFSLPNSLGSTVRMKQTPVKLFLQARAWDRTGGGMGAFYGTRVGRRSALGVGGWSSGSTTTPREYFQGYTGASMLTEKSLIFVDRGGITRAAVKLQDILSSSISPSSDSKLVISYGKGVPKTMVFEYSARGRGEAARIAAQWYEAVSSSITQVQPMLVGSG